MDEQHTKSRHETGDVAVWPILLSGIILTVGTALVIGLSIIVFRYFTGRPDQAAPNPLTSKAEPTPGPRIEEHPARELEQLRQNEDRILTTYGWVDKQNGIVRIPIERAIELQLERGFPTRKETAKK